MSGIEGPVQQKKKSRRAAHSGGEGGSSSDWSQEGCHSILKEDVWNPRGLKGEKGGHLNSRGKGTFYGYKNSFVNWSSGETRQPELHEKKKKKIADCLW